jgi:hypothetical protein
MTATSKLRLAPLLATGLAGVLVATLSPATQPAADAALIAPLDRRLEAPSIVESSGLARSTYDRNILWTHNDSGGRAEVFAIRPDGSTAGVVKLRGASMRDWEDISSGPKNNLWVADVGDNRSRRSEINLYRFNEPQALGNRTVDATRFDFKYGDGRAHNSEALLIHPTTRRIYIVTKSPSGGAIYRAPQTLSKTSRNVLTRIASAPKKITAASFSPDGRRFVLCNYSTAFLYRGFDSNPVQLGKPRLNQGESIEFNRANTAIFMGSEGRKSPVYRVPVG